MAPGNAQGRDNLLVNPGAEQSSGAADNHDPTHPPAGWTVTGGFTVVKYGNGFPGPEVAADFGGGTNFFGGSSESFATASQRVHLSTADRRLARSGDARLRLAGYLGGYFADADEGTLNAVVLGPNRTELARLALGPVSPAQRNYQSEFLPLSVTAALPSAARSVVVTMAAVERSPECNDSYFDNLSLKVRRPPKTSQ